MTAGFGFVSVVEQEGTDMTPARLLAIYAGAPAALAHITPTPIVQQPVRVPEIDWAIASSALIGLAGVFAVVRSRLRG